MHFPFPKGVPAMIEGHLSLTESVDASTTVTKEALFNKKTSALKKHQPSVHLIISSTKTRATSNGRGMHLVSLRGKVSERRNKALNERMIQLTDDLLTCIVLLEKSLHFKKMSILL